MPTRSIRRYDLSRTRCGILHAAPQSRNPGFEGHLHRDPGSAAHHHSASKTRVNALVALRSVQGTHTFDRDVRSELIMSLNRPTLPLTGGCSCGVIRYEIASFPLLLYTCNCTDCQTRSGSAFALNMPVQASGFRILAGEPKAWRYTSPKGSAVISWFCGDCGARIYGERAGRADIVNVRAGTLNDTSWLVPAAHFFSRSNSA